MKTRYTYFFILVLAIFCSCKASKHLGKETVAQPALTDSVYKDWVIYYNDQFDAHAGVVPKPGENYPSMAVRGYETAHEIWTSQVKSAHAGTVFLITIPALLFITGLILLIPTHTHTYSNSSGSCFITTATLVSIGKTDNCDELNSFRNFRDNWLLKQQDGDKLVSEYYKTAPLIVEAINTRRDSKEIYAQLWKEKIEPCFVLIKEKRFAETKTIYCNAVTELKEKYLDKVAQEQLQST